MNYFWCRLLAAVMSVAMTYAMCLIVTLRPSPARAGETAIRSSSQREDAKVARGRYLIRTTGCNDCHTPGYAETAGSVEESKWLTGSSLGWQGPWGTTYPPNLRQLVQRMDVGTWMNHARRQTRPPMPWFALRDMSDEDLAAIYAFIRSLGPSSAKVPAYAPPGTPAATAVVKFPEPELEAGPG